MLKASHLHVISIDLLLLGRCYISIPTTNICNSLVKEEKLVQAPFDLLKRSSSNQENLTAILSLSIVLIKK